MKQAAKREPVLRQRNDFVSKKVTTVPPTREARARVVVGHAPSKYSMFWNDKENRAYHELHVVLRGARLTTIEGICGEPLTQTVCDFSSPAAAKASFEATRREKHAAWWQTVGKGQSTDFFFVGPPKKAKDRAEDVDATPVPSLIDGYASDGRMVADIAKLLPDAKKLGKKLAAGTQSELTTHARALPTKTQKALVGISEACVRGKLRELCWSFTLGHRLAAECTSDDLADLLGGNRKWIELAADAIEIFHDGGLAHYVACRDGVRVYNHEGSFEAVITPSVDAFMWALVHRTAVKQGTYDTQAFAAGLKKLRIARELALTPK